MADSGAEKRSPLFLSDKGMPELLVHSEGCHDPETVRWVRVRRHPLRLQCRSSYYVQLSLSGLPTGKWQRLRSNRRRSESCGADAWGAAVSQNRWQRRQSDRTRFLPDLRQPRDRQIGTAAQHPRIAGGKLGRPINVPTHDGRIYLKRAALGSHGPQGPKAHARRAAVMCASQLVAKAARIERQRVQTARSVCRVCVMRSFSQSAQSRSR
jgi:hypothetical protein